MPNKKQVTNNTANSPAPGKRDSSPSLNSPPAKKKRPNAPHRAWTPDEEARFWDGVEEAMRGNWKVVAAKVGTRDSHKCACHFDAFLKRVEKRE
ncbi:hypothetical protein HK104_002633 [Borealophlyctis nickersoniae]|nr:hypothetical protein HK104_002633 [Borealophlyctis nickersoniae]